MILGSSRIGYRENNWEVMTLNKEEIRFFEELQVNAFPALQTIRYDGWDIRFGGGFTYRVNCANPMYPERIPIEEKIAYTEKCYEESSLELSIFKLHEGMDETRLNSAERILEEKGYERLRDGNIFVCDLKSFGKAPNITVEISGEMTDRWLDGFLTMNGTADAQRTAAAAMLKNISYPILAASVVENGKMVACCLGVMERGYVGLYDLYVDATCRRRGLGGDVCTAIMNAAKSMGCQKAYLQVLADNYGARTLYRQLGYKESYGYWFRVKNILEK